MCTYLASGFVYCSFRGTRHGHTTCPHTPSTSSSPSCRDRSPSTTTRMALLTCKLAHPFILHLCIYTHTHTHTHTHTCIHTTTYTLTHALMLCIPFHPHVHAKVECTGRSGAPQHNSRAYARGRTAHMRRVPSEGCRSYHHGTNYCQSNHQVARLLAMAFVHARVNNCFYFKNIRPTSL